MDVRPSAGGAFVLGSLSLARGEKGTGSLPVGQRPAGGWLTIPLLVANGVHDGPVLCVDASTHGDEGEGTDAVLRIFQTIDTSMLRGTFIGVPVVNPAAFDSLERSNPLDRFCNADLNRVYPGIPAGSLTDRTAYLYFENVVRRSTHVISLHGGGNYALLPPHVTYGALEGEQEIRTLEFAKSIGWGLIWRGIPYKGMLVDVAPTTGVIAVCAEFGGGGDRTPSMRERYVTGAVTGVRSAMTFLGMLNGNVVKPQQWTVLEGGGHVFSDLGGVFRPKPDLLLGKPIKEGDEVGSVIDIMGTREAIIRAPRSGILMNIRTYPVIYPGDLITGVAGIRETIDR